MIILLSGDDTYRSRKRLERLREAFREKFDPSGVNTITLDGETLKPEAFSQHVSSQGFLASKRCIAVLNVLGNGKQETQEAISETLAADGIPEDNIVIFWEDGEPPSKRVPPKQVKKGKTRKSDASLWQLVLQKAKHERFPLLEPVEIQSWIEAEVQKRGGMIDRKAAKTLATIGGQNLWQVSGEIDKLISYALGRVIDDTDVDQLVSATVDDDIFRLTDALGQRDLKLALRLFEDQFQSGADPLYLLRMLSWHLRNLLAVRSLMDEGTRDPRTIARVLKLHPFVAQKTVHQAEYFTFDDLLWAFGQLLQIDHTIKTRRIDPRVLFDLLTVSLLKRVSA